VHSVVDSVGRLPRGRDVASRGPARRHASARRPRPCTPAARAPPCGRCAGQTAEEERGRM
ncbi:MAG: hypothetical protein AVDCRST_MAG68-2654, partial [uncultured Gemmatimonadetes bacterium]